MAKYKYELHFPYSKELFESDLEFEEFVDQFNHGAVENVNGDMVALMSIRMVTYVKQVDNNKPF